MMIKVVDAYGAFHIHEDIENAVAYSGQYEFQNPFYDSNTMSPPKRGADESPVFPYPINDPIVTCTSRIPAPEVFGPMDTAFPNAIWLDSRIFKPRIGIYEQPEHRSVPVKMIDAITKEGYRRRYIFDCLAYICNDEGKTTHKEEVRHTPMPIQPAGSVK